MGNWSETTSDQYFRDFDNKMKTTREVANWKKVPSPLEMKVATENI